MAKHNVGPKNGLWKGGRSVASNGYMLIRVGGSHHLADVRGYAYEHRLVAEQVLGRQLRHGEVVHHRDGNKQNNDPGNLEILDDIATHRFAHRSGTSKLRYPGESNISVSCACGCGVVFPKFDACGRPRLFVSGHNRPPRDAESGRFHG